MSSDERSREALSPEENSSLYSSFIRLNQDEFQAWCGDSVNTDKMELADESTKAAYSKKVEKFSVDKTKDMIDSGQGPTTVIKKEKLLKPPDTDIEIVKWDEFRAGEETHTMDYINVPVREGEPSDSRIERVIGRDQNAPFKLKVTYQPAKRVKILPEWVLRYRGSVVTDRNAVHSSFVTYRKVRHGYSFGNFFIHNGKKLARCCLVQDRMHQAGLIYEKFVPKGASKGIIRMKKLPGTQNEPMYEIVKKTDVAGDYRDLKILFERHFLGKNDMVQHGDPALEKLINEAMPDV